MRRRQLLVALGGATLWPVAVRAQQSAMPLVGVLSSGSAAESAPQLITLRRGLSELGYIEGKNVLFDIAGARATMNGCRGWRPILSGSTWS
jgi:putative ABC transport system substrate-binding protein